MKIEKIALLFIFLNLIIGCTKKQNDNQDINQISRDTVLVVSEQLVNDSGKTQQTHAVNSAIEQFITEGYTTLDTASGDLNRDSIPDMLLILRKQQECEAEQGDEKRLLMVLTGNGDGTYKKNAENNRVVYCCNCGGAFGDPYSGLTIKNGYFSIEHYGGAMERWTRIITFKYNLSKGGWYLHRDGRSSFSSMDADGAKTSESMKTVDDFGVVNFTEFDVYAD